MKEKKTIQGYDPIKVRDRLSYSYPFFSIILICFVVVVGHEGLRIL